MAKVYLTLTSSAKANFKQETIERLEAFKIPFEKDGDTIYLISKKCFNSGEDLKSREYDKSYSEFCMRLADSTDGSIGMGEKSLNKEELEVLYEIFGKSLFFEISLSCGNDNENLTAEVVLNQVNKEYEVVTELEEEEDDEEEIHYLKCSRCGTLNPEDEECQCNSIKTEVIETEVYQNEINNLRLICREMHEKEIEYSKWATFFQEKGFDATQKLNLEIKLDEFTFLITNKENTLPLKINFIEGMFAGWIKK